MEMVEAYYLKYKFIEAMKTLDEQIVQELG